MRARLGVVVVLAVVAWWLPAFRRTLIFDVTYYDAAPAEPVQLPGGSGPGLSRVPRTRVVLVDGLRADLAPSMPTWSALCKRGLTLRVDVGFPTVSLPVEVALWTGLTQQQTGVVNRGGGKDGRYGHPLDPPLGKRGIPAQLPDSVAVAEDHGWIVRSLGFSRAHPGAGATPVDDQEPERWHSELIRGQGTDFQNAARYAVASPASLVFVHILRVDTAAHRFGIGPFYGKAVAEADAILANMLAGDPSARWFVVSDHGHVGTHGGEERELRQVEACIAGPGVAVGRGELVHVVDLSRAIADSTGATLDPGSRARPMSVAIAAPLEPDQAVPPLELGRGVLAIFFLAAGLGLAGLAFRRVASLTSGRRWYAAPWWFVLAAATLVVVEGEPTLSKALVYAPGSGLIVLWVPAFVVCAATTWFALGKTTLARALGGQLAFPLAALAACVSATGAWPCVVGADQAPVVPRYTAWLSPLLLAIATGAAAVALAVLARLVRQAFDRRARAALRRSETADGG